MDENNLIDKIIDKLAKIGAERDTLAAKLTRSEAENADYFRWWQNEKKAREALEAKLASTFPTTQPRPE